MNVDNSGPTIVLDPKSQEAVDAIRDRITLLESEVARLSKLKANLDDSIRKTDAELAYKNTCLDEATLTLVETNKRINEAIAQEVEITNDVEAMKVTLETAQKDMDEQARALTERENSLSERESHMDARAQAITDAEIQIDKETKTINENKTAIAELLTKL